MLSQKRFEKQNEKKKKDTEIWSHKTGRFLTDINQQVSICQDFHGANTTIMAWMLAITIGAGSVLKKILKYCTSLSSLWMLIIVQICWENKNVNDKCV